MTTFHLIPFKHGVALARNEATEAVYSTGGGGKISERFKVPLPTSQQRDCRMKKEFKNLPLVQLKYQSSNKNKNKNYIFQHNTFTVTFIARLIVEWFSRI